MMSEVSQKERNRYSMMSHMWDEKKHKEGNKAIRSVLRDCFLVMKLL